MPVLFRTTGTMAGPEFVLRRTLSAAPVRFPVTCAIVERPDGLLLIDTGWSRAQCAWPERDPGRLTMLTLGMQVRAEDALASQLISLGYDPKDVRHVIATHLHVDHVGGVSDFPHATVHCAEAEWQARKLGLRGGYSGRVSFADRLQRHALNGPGALGFGASHDLFGDGSVLLLDAHGHTRGSVAVAVRLEGGKYLLHVGDACMTRAQYRDPSANRPWIYDRAVAHDVPAMLHTRQVILAAERDHGATVVPSHDAEAYASLPTTVDAAMKAAWDEGKKKQGGAGKNGGKKNGGGRAEKTDGKGEAPPAEG